MLQMIDEAFGANLVGISGFIVMPLHSIFLSKKKNLVNVPIRSRRMEEGSTTPILEGRN